ncbi:hypothetical protein DH2020_007869 [Rehmannia glutinosa]|uniref:Histone-lysine N-methyltransferase n=1 Tax=Rehmannia glutinosa TaxID=99300 RepID=A0ABR0U0D5_REHGL
MHERKMSDLDKEYEWAKAQYDHEMESVSVDKEVSTYFDWAICHGRKTLQESGKASQKLVDLLDFRIFDEEEGEIKALQTSQWMLLAKREMGTMMIESPPRIEHFITLISPRVDLFLKDGECLAHFENSGHLPDHERGKLPRFEVCGHLLDRGKNAFASLQGLWLPLRLEHERGLIVSSTRMYFLASCNNPPWKHEVSQLWTHLTIPSGDLYDPSFPQLFMERVLFFPVMFSIYAGILIFMTINNVYVFKPAALVYIMSCKHVKVFRGVPYESSCVRADESSAAMVTSDVSEADVLLPAFDSISFAELPELRNDIANNTITTDALSSIWEADPPGQRTDEEKTLVDLILLTLPGLPIHLDMVVKLRSWMKLKTPKPNHPLIVYTSLRRKSVRNTNIKINQNTESRKPSRNCQKSVRKSGNPTGHISLKIKIGNQSCGMVHFPENFNASEKSIPGLPDIMESRFGERLSGDMVLPHDRKLEKVLSSDVSVLGTHLDVRGRVENSSLSTSSDLHQIIGHEERDNLRASTENRCSDPGTSPDSEVINSVPDAPLLEKGSQNTPDTPIMPMERINQKCFTNSVPDVSFGDVSSLAFPQRKPKKGKKKDKHHQLGGCNVENKLTGAKTTNSASSNRVPSGPSHCSRMSDSGIPSTTSKVYNGAEMNPFSGLVAPIESLNSQDGGSLIPCSNGQKFSKCSRAKGERKSRSEILDISSKKDKVSKKKGNKNNLVSKLQIDEKGDASGVLSGVENHLVAGISEIIVNSVGNQTSSDLGEAGYLSKGSSGPLNSLQFSSGGLMDQYVPPRNAWVLCDECQQWRRIQATLADQIEETNSGWTCKDNTDKDFADCSIPQEKSNSEINEELEISDASCEEDACGALLTSNRHRSKAAQQPSSFSLIKSNLFLHRNRKTQTIDEVMVCHCKPPSDGRMGCGAKCLNRMLNIECVRELAHVFQKRKYAKLKWFRCGKKGFGLQALEDISEGKFLIEYVGEVLDMHAYEARQREYALQGHKHFYFMTLNGSEVIDACAKGNLGRFINHSCDPNCRTEKWMVNGEVCVGLFAVRDIKKGEEVTFDYNYVRVFGAAAKKCVCGSPSCRGYIGGGPTNAEVIVQGDSDDEYAEPVMTCEDREMNNDWKDIISNSLRDRENGSANELPENRYRTKKLVSVDAQLESITSGTSTEKVGVDSASTDGCFKMSTATQVVDYEPDYSVTNDFASNAAVGPLDTLKDHGESLNISASAASNVESEGLRSQMNSSVQLVDVSFQSEDVINKALSSAGHPPRQEVTTPALPSKSQRNAIDSKRKLKYATLGGKEELTKPESLVKTRLSSSIKKGKLKSSVMNGKRTLDVDKSNAATYKSKTLPDLSLNSHVEAGTVICSVFSFVDASRGYLKLLFLTAATGTNGHGEAIQSNRDLSMILDAILKTKSRTVLVDIINKNGLQMLHNIMKRYRKEFIKTPILRKLLKVLEYLATREILTLEHITGGPPRPGIYIIEVDYKNSVSDSYPNQIVFCNLSNPLKFLEIIATNCFKDSMLTLTEHTDKQVHQIARNFRDRWIPRSLRRKCFMEMDDGKMEPHHSSYGRLSVSSSYDHSNDRGGKPAELTVASGTVEASTLNHSAVPNSSNGTTETRIRKRKSRWDNPPEEHPRIRTKLSGDKKPNSDVDIPPGFSSPCKDSASPGFSSPSKDSPPPGFSSPCKNSIVPADASITALNHQERNVCINPPFDIVSGDSHKRFISSMPVSYGVPYSVMQQFGVLQAETAESWKLAPGFPFHPFPPLPPYAKCSPINEPAEKSEQGNGTCVAHDSGPSENISVANEFQREGVGCNSLGRKFFRQQKWNHTKPVPPWVRMRNGWGHGAPPGVAFGNGGNQFRNSYT